MEKRELIVTSTHDGRARTVVVEGPQADGRFHIAIDGRLQVVDAREIRSGTWSLLFDGMSVVVDIDNPGSAPRPPSGTSKGRRGFPRVTGGRPPAGGVRSWIDTRRSAAGGGVVASVGASELALVVEDAAQLRLAKSAGVAGGVSIRGELLRAPIAGKVVKLSVALGDVVPPSTPVIAIEAMKMENELVCERGGTVAAIHKHVGQAVDAGDVLIEFS